MTATRRPAGRSARTSTGRSRQRHARSRRVLRRRVAPASTVRRRAARDAAGVRRAAVVQAVLSLRRAATGWTAIPASRRRRRAPAAAAITTGRTSTTPTSSRCPTSGNIPWYAAWDLAFHCVPLALVDPEFAKEQLVLLLREWYMHPERPAAGLRMGVRRRQSAGARLGGLARLQDRARSGAASATARFSSASSTSCC